MTACDRPCCSERLAWRHVADLAIDTGQCARLTVLATIHALRVSLRRQAVSR